MFSSNKSKKVAAKEYNLERQQYYKKLRREQKKKRRERKRQAKGSKGSASGQGPSNQPKAPMESAGKNLKRPLSCEKASNQQPRAAKRKREDRPLSTQVLKEEKNIETTWHEVRAKSPQLYAANLTRGKAMVSASLQRRKLISKPVPASANKLPGILEIKPASLKRSDANSIGHGSFGTCYLAVFRGIQVVVKEYKSRPRSDDTVETQVERMQREAKKEAEVIRNLGDHPGIPLLFGVCLKEQPISLVLKYHSDNTAADTKSLTVFRAAMKQMVKEKHHWKGIFAKIADALQHVHSCGYVHNDIKSNNVVLEKREDGVLSPVIIDFGKSVLVTRAKRPPAKPAHLISLFKYVAPELLEGSGKPSTESDVYSFAYMAKEIFKIVGVDIKTSLKKALSKLPKDRPSMQTLKLSFD